MASIIYATLPHIKNEGSSKAVDQKLIQANFDVVIPILGTSSLSAQIKKEELTYKEESQTRFKFYHVKPNL